MRHELSAHGGDDQVTKESRWKLPKSKSKKKHQEPSLSVEDAPVALEPVEEGARRHRHRNGSSKKDAAPAQEEPTAQTETRLHKRRGSSKADNKGDEAAGSMRSRVQLLQASLAGRIGNPMGPRPAQIKIPTSNESEDQGDSSQSFLFGAGSMPVQDEYKAETAHMSAAERLRYLRRKRQEATLTKEKSVLDDGFMQEFTRNMKQKESTGGGSRSQAATKRWKEQEEAEQERKRVQLLEEQERKRQEEAEREARELAKEIEEEEVLRREKEDEEKRKRKEKSAEEESSLREKEIEENRVMDEKRAKEERLQKENEAKERKKTDEAEGKQHQKDRYAEEDTVKHKKHRHDEEEKESALKTEQEEIVIPPAAADDEENERKREKEKRRERRRKEKEAALRIAGEAAADTEQSGANDIRESNDSGIPNKRRSRKHEQHDVDTASDEISHDLDQLSVSQENGIENLQSEKSQGKPRKTKKKAQLSQDPVDEEEPLDDSRKSMHPPGSYLNHSHEYHSHGHEQHAHVGHRCVACEQNAATMGLTTMPYPPPMPYGGMCACGYPAAGVPYAVALPPPSMAYYGYPPPPPPMQMQMLPPPYAMAPSPPPSYGGTSTAMTMYSQGPSSGYGGYGAPVMLSKCQGCGGVGVDVAEKNGFCAHCNRLRLDFIVASAQIRRRCSSCGGWGLQLVQASGKCQHCERQEKLRAVGGFQQRASSSSTPKLEAKTQARDNDEDWDESSDEGSDWDE